MPDLPFPVVEILVIVLVVFISFFLLFLAIVIFYLVRWMWHNLKKFVKNALVKSLI